MTMLSLQTFSMLAHTSWFVNERRSGKSPATALADLGDETYTFGYNVVRGCLGIGGQVSLHGMAVDLLARTNSTLVQI